MVLRWFTAPSLAGIAYFIQQHIPGIRNLYPWAFPLIAAIVGIGISLLLTAIRLKLRLTEYETPKLEMWHETLEAPNPFTHHFSPSGDILFRIGIKGPPGKTIQGVKVSLKQFWPQGAEFLPQALNPMSRDFAGETSPTFTLNPDVPHYVDVIRWIPAYHDNTHAPSKAPRPVYAIMYLRNDLPKLIEHNQYRFKLIAEGTDVPPSEKDFEVAFDDKNRPIFRQLASRTLSGSQVFKS